MLLLGLRPDDVSAWPAIIWGLELAVVVVVSMSLIIWIEMGGLDACILAACQASRPLDPVTLFDVDAGSPVDEQTSCNMSISGGQRSGDLMMMKP